MTQELWWTITVAALCAKTSLHPFLHSFLSSRPLNYKSGTSRNISLNSGKVRPWRWKTKIQKTKLSNSFWKQHFTDKKAQEGDRWTQVHTTSLGQKQEKNPLFWCLAKVSLHRSLHCKEEVNINSYSKLNSTRYWGFLVGILQKWKGIFNLN